jgi:hypothetical protein
VSVVRRIVVLVIAVASLISALTATALIAKRTPASDASVPTSHLNAAALSAPVRTVRPGVAPLRHLAQPDLFITTNGALSSVQVARLRAAVRARSSTVVDVGTAKLAGRLVHAIGVDPSQFRGFTPPPTAASDQLWNNLAGGDLAATYDVARTQHLTLGVPVAISVHGRQSQRIGAFAAFGFPQVDVVMTRAAASTLGLHYGTGVILSAPGRTSAAMVAAARRVLGAKAHIVVLRPDSSSYSGKPRTYRELYQAAARTCPGLSWTILAAIGQLESDHGVNVGPSTAGALGPMQFMPETWAAWARDGDGDHKADIMNPYDSVYAAAAYLCWNGAGRGGSSLAQAVFRYNHADWYVKEVLALALLYR